MAAVARFRLGGHPDYQPSFENVQKTESDAMRKVSTTTTGYTVRKTSQSYSPGSVESGKNIVLNAAIPEPLLTPLTKDSLADLTPVQLCPSRKSGTPLRLSSEKPAMVDQVTSDVRVTKSVKELQLQACPDFRDAATNSLVLPVRDCRSASAITSRCVLPPTCCRGEDNPTHNADCLFVYGRPQCVIHRLLTDVSVQMHPSRHDVEAEARKEQAVNQSVGSMSSYGVVAVTSPLLSQSTSPMLSNSPPQYRPVVGEVLSPRVYKALYETTRQVAQEKKMSSLKSSFTHPYPIDTDKDSSVSGRQKVSAAILATDCSFDSTAKRCYCGAPCQVEVSSAEKEVSKFNTRIDTATHTHTPQLSSVAALTSGIELDAHCTCNISTHCTGTYPRLLQQVKEDRICVHCRRLLEMSLFDVNGQTDSLEDYLRSHLLESCRYYSSLLASHIGCRDSRKSSDEKTESRRYTRAPSTEKRMQHAVKDIDRQPTKPVVEFACQTGRRKLKQPVSCYLSPTTSVLNIAEGEDLRAVYCMLSAIEGRIRRLKNNVA